MSAGSGILVPRVKEAPGVLLRIKSGESMGESAVRKTPDVEETAVDLIARPVTPAGNTASPNDPTSPGAPLGAGVLMFILSVFMTLAVISPVVLISPFWPMVTRPLRMSTPKRPWDWSLSGPEEVLMEAQEIPSDSPLVRGEPVDPSLDKGRLGGIWEQESRPFTVRRPFVSLPVIDTSIRVVLPSTLSSPEIVAALMSSDWIALLNSPERLEVWICPSIILLSIAVSEAFDSLCPLRLVSSASSEETLELRVTLLLTSSVSNCDNDNGVGPDKCRSGSLKSGCAGAIPVGSTLHLTVPSEYVSITFERSGVATLVCNPVKKSPADKGIFCWFKVNSDDRETVFASSS